MLFKPLHKGFQGLAATGARIRAALTALEEMLQPGS